VSAVDEADESVSRIASTSYQTLDGIEGDPRLSEAEEQQVAPVRQNVLSMRELEALFWLVLWANLGAVVVFLIELLLPRLKFGKRITRISIRVPRKTDGK